MIAKLKNGREVEIVDICWASAPEDSYAQEAYYLDTGEPVEDETYDELNEAASESIQAGWYEHMVAEAEWQSDLAQDR